ncbi:putative transposase, partial [Phenoliferia sp. Uapishka_3]
MDDSSLYGSFKTSSISFPAPLPEKERLAKDGKNYRPWRNAVELRVIGIGGYNILTGLEKRPERPEGYWIQETPQISRAATPESRLHTPTPTGDRKGRAAGVEEGAEVKDEGQEDDQRPPPTPPRAPPVYFAPDKKDLELYYELDRDYIKRASAVYSIITINLHSDVLEEVHDARLSITPSILFKLLTDRYGRTTNSDQFSLFREVLNLKCGDGADLQTHFNSFNKVHRRLRDLIEPELQPGIDKVLSFALLASLPSEFGQFVINMFSTEQPIDMNAIQRNALMADTLLRPAAKSGGAFKALTSGEGYLGAGGGQDRQNAAKTRKACTFGPCPSKESHEESRCFYKHPEKAPHWLKEKWEREAKEKDKEKPKPTSPSSPSPGPAPSSSSAIANSASQPSVYLPVRSYGWMARPKKAKGKEVEVTPPPKSSKLELITDSGCSITLSPHLSHFSSFDDSVTTPEITIADGRHLKVERQGTMHIDALVDGEIVGLNISNALYVPDASHSLISVSKLCEQGRAVVFVEESMRIVDRDSGELIATGSPHEGVYLLDLPSSPPPSFANIARPLAMKVVPHDLAHRRFAHTNPEILKMMKTAGLIKCGDHDPNSTCIVCIKGKAPALPYPRTRNLPRPDKFSHLATDLQDFGALSYDGKRYNFLVIDLRTKTIVSIPIKQKSDAFGELVKVVAKLECQNSPIRVKRIYSDPGGEYVGGEMLEWMDEKGIEHVMGAAGKHKDNPYAERANRTMVEGTRCMLIDANLVERFWSAAIRYRTWLYNRLFNKAGEMPFKEATGKLPDLSMVKVFGCDAHSLLPPTKRTKAGSKTKGMIFMGIEDTRRAWMLWNLRTKKMEFRSDVYFDERSKLVALDRSDEAIDSDEDELREYRGKLRQAEATGSDEENEESESDGEEDVFNDAEGEPEDSEEETPAPYGRDNLRRGTRIRKQRDPQQIASAALPPPEPPPFKQLSLPTIPYRPDDSCEDDLVRALVAEMPPSISHAPTKNPLIEPKSMIKAIEGPDRVEWIAARDVEMGTLQRLRVYTLVPPWEVPDGESIIHLMWVLKNKMNGLNELLKRKVRLVAADGWEAGKDFDDLFSPVISNDSLTLLLSIACFYDLELDQLDVVGAFLHAEMKKPWYTRQPVTCVVKGKETWLWKITKALYGFPISPREWNLRSSDDLLQIGFIRCRTDPCVFTLRVGKIWTCIAGYVDDFVILSNSRLTSAWIKRQLSKCWDVQDMGELEYLLGMAISRDRTKRQIAWEQTGLIMRLLERLGLTEC